MKFRVNHLGLLLTLIIFLVDPLSAQAEDEVEQDTTVFKKARNGRFLALPLVTYSPETSLRLSAISVYFFRFKESPPGTQLSSIRLPISYTLENQVKVSLSYEIFFRGNKHILKGYNTWIRFPFQFYGIGSDTQEEDQEAYTSETFGIDINYFRRIHTNFYAGVRYNRHDTRITEYEDGGLLSQEGLIPGSEGGVTSGVGLIGRFDKRDNIFNSTTGPFIEWSVTTYQDGLGSDFDYTKLKLDFRHYFGGFSNRHIVAVQSVFQQNWGEPPFESLALLGGSRIMRGHYRGRFRDKGLWAAQLEYRIALGRNSWIDEREKVPFLERWGVVGFAGFGNVTEQLSDPEFNDIKLALGVGLRYMVLPKERVNIRIDFGFGTQTPGFYLSIREAF